MLDFTVVVEMIPPEPDEQLTIRFRWFGKRKRGVDGEQTFDD